MKRLKYIIITIIFIVFIINLDIVISSTKDATILFFNKLFVTIFPFIILSDILIYYDYHIFLNKIFGKTISKLFNIDKNTTIVFILSILTSQPCNSLYIKDLLDKKIIDINTANKLLCFTYFPSISFVIGTIGLTIFNSFKIGLLLYFLTLLNNILIGLFLRKDKSNQLEKVNIIKDNNLFIILKKSILKAFNTLSIILGNLIFFTIILNIINKYTKINIILKSIIYSTIEITNAINIISTINNIHLKFILTLFSLTISSLSILFQSFSILSDYNINKKRIIITKLLFSLLFILLLALIYFLIEVTSSFNTITFIIK